MKRLKTELTYIVPHWSFCNCDANPTNKASLKYLCKFCVKEGSKYRCALHEEPLTHDSMFVDKAPKCNSITRGSREVISSEPINVPAIDPKILMKHTLEAYEKQVRDLKSQGYPEALAMSVAKEYILGGNL